MVEPTTCLDLLIASARRACRYENTTYKADRIICVDCEKRWGWKGCHDSLYGRVPIERFACCNKALGRRKPKQV